jgi:sortase (surface protein transpeptidase)
VALQHVQKRNSFSRFVRAFIIIFIIAGVLAGGVWAYRHYTEKPAPSAPQQEVVPPPKNTHQSTLTAPERPTRLTVPGISVDTTIDPVGLDADGAMGVPRSLKTVGWYDKSAQLGESHRPVILDGHYGLDSSPGVFYKLRTLAIGDTFTITGTYGKTVEYTVTSVETAPLEVLDMEKVFNYGDGKKETAVIITCEGTFDSRRATYNNRYVVYADRKE